MSLSYAGDSASESVEPVSRSLVARLPWHEPLGSVAEALAVIALGVDALIIFGNSVVRFLFGWSLAWVPDLSLISLSVIVFLGSAAAYRKGEPMAFTLFLEKAPLYLQQGMKAARTSMVAVLAAITLTAFPPFFESSLGIARPGLGVTEAWATVWMGLGYALILVFAVAKLTSSYRVAKIDTLAGAGSVAILASAFLLYVGAEPSVPAIDPVASLIVGIALAFAIGVPIPFVLGIGSYAFIFATRSLPAMTGPISYQGGIESFILLAVPFFMLAGELMLVSGMGERLFATLDALLGRLRGGLLVSTVGTMYVFAGMSGSEVADVAAVGNVIKGPMKVRGYPQEETVAVLAASASMGITIPPSVAMLIYASVTGLSVSAMFAAGLLPAFVLALALVAAVLIRGRGGVLPRGPAFRLGVLRTTLLPALPAFMVPLIIVGGIVLGIATPTEVSSFAVIYGLLVAALLYRSLPPRAYWGMLRNAAQTAGMVLFVVSTAHLLGLTLLYARIDTMIGSLAGLGAGPLGFLVASVLFLVLLGMAFEGVPALLVFGPILLPIAVGYGIDPLHFGIVSVSAIGIGVFGPPLGFGFYAASAVVGAAPHKVFVRSAYYVGILLIGLLLVVAVPDITLALPRLLGLHK